MNKCQNTKESNDLIHHKSSDIPKMDLLNQQKEDKDEKFNKISHKRRGGVIISPESLAFLSYR